MRLPRPCAIFCVASPFPVFSFSVFCLHRCFAGIQLVFALLVGGGKDWVADIAGFAAGFGLAFLVSPGGWAAVKRRIRRQ